MSPSPRPQIGIGVIVRKDGKVLLGKRIGAHGKGTWGFPGGHLELFEEVFDCAKRETLEETDITLTNLTVGPYTNDIMQETGKHYVTLFVIADYAEGEVQVREPDKCEVWQWFDWHALPTPLFLPIQNLLKTDFNPFTL
jgi:8-oxo-dGTP diphosphatase